MLVLTVVSGIDYFVHARQGFQEHAEMEAGADEAAADGEREDKG